MNVRKLLFWCHLTVGSIAGIVIFTMRVTGVLLAFERQIISYAERDFRVITPVDGHRLPLESLLEKARAANPTPAPISIAWKSASIVAAGGAMLAFTGLSLAVRRLLANLARRRNTTERAANRSPLPANSSTITDDAVQLEN